MKKNTNKFYSTLATLVLFGIMSNSCGAESPRTGTFIHTLSFVNDTAMTFKASVPEDLPKKKKLGLIIAFHPHGGNENSMVDWPCKTFLERQKVLDNYIIIGLKSLRPKGYKEYLGDWEIADHEPTYEVFQWVMNTYPIDSRRVHLIGWSRGGFMTTRFVWKNVKHFATVTAFAGAHSPDWTKSSLGGYPNQDWVKLKQSIGRRMNYRIDFNEETWDEYLPTGRDRKESIAESLPEFYHVHGDSDYVIDVNLTRSYTRELRKKGVRYVYRELDGVNHAGVFQGKPVNFAVNDDVFAWIHATRNKILPLDEADEKTLMTIEENIRQMPSHQAISLIHEAARIGGHQAGKVLIKAFDSQFVEVRLAVVRSGYTSNYGPVFIAKLGEIIRDPKRAKEVRFNACHVLGTYAKWGQLDALKILSDTVLDPKLGQYIRFQLITALSRSYEFMVLGNMYDDRKVIYTLVKLLDDSDAGVRGYAHMVLKKGTNGEAKFGYNAGHNKSERQASILLWQQWAKQNTVPLLSDHFVEKQKID